jgi:hypothetical protein
VSGDLTNFPVLIDLYDTDLHDSVKIQADGDDLAFTTASGIQLDHEIEHFNQTGNGTHAHLVAWVRVPSLSATEDTDILMYYGNKGAVNKENPEGVWDSNYMLVQHLQETDIDGGSGDIKDSTSGNNDGTTAGMDTSDQVDGKIDGSLEFDGVNDNIATEESNMMADLSSFTISAWIKPQASQSDFCGIVEFDNTTDGSSFDVAMELRSTRVPRVNVWTTSGFDYLDSSTVLPTTSFTYFVFVYNGNLTIYLDGLFDDSTSHSGNIRNNYRYLNIGRNTHDGRSFNGIIDEVRISNLVRSIEWIQTEYNNQDDPGTFYSIANEEENSNYWADGSFRYRKKITINSSKVSTDLINFPFLIDLTDNDLKSGRVQSDADDIIFIDQTGAKLDHEIESFQQNSSLGRLNAWVRIPSLSSISNTNITLYYGNSAVKSQENVNGVWGDYAGVWHLSEISGNVLDSTSYSEDGTIQGTDVTQGVTGIIDGAYNFGSGDGRVDFSDPADGHLDFGTGNLTISFWLKSNYSSEYQRPVFKGASSDGYAGYGFYRRGGQTATVLAVSDNSLRYKTTTTLISNDVWTYIVGVLDRSTNEWISYYDAIPTSPEDISTLGSMDGSAILSFGRVNNEINGSLDEVRLTSFTRSLGWIQTEYNNQYDPTSFISVTTEEMHPNWWTDASFGKRKDIAIDKDQVSGDLSNFPVLIDIYDPDLRTDVQTDAADLMFTDSSNIKLDHEIELFDQTGNGTHAHLVAWVNVPTLFNNTDTLVSMYYGNSKLSSQENPTSVWDSGYRSVWHLNNDPTGLMYDSTSNSFDGTSGGSMTQTDLVSGKTGEAIEFDGFNDYIAFPDPLNTESMTLSSWIYLNDVSEQWITIAMRSDGTAWFDWQIYARASDAETLANRAVFRTDYPDTSEVGSDVILATGNWYYITTEHNGTHNLFFINGTLVDVDLEPDTVGDSNSDLWIAGNEVWGEHLQGLMDEVRVSTVARSEDWIAIEYNNQYDPTSFYTVGSEYELDTTPPVVNNFGVEDPGTGTGIFWADITDAHSNVDSATIKINGTEYGMSSNGTHWVKQLSIDFNGYYIYQISNTSDMFGNSLSSPSNNKSYTFNFDSVFPSVLDWEYISSNNTFQTNITDSWGAIDTVIVNVTTHSLTAIMVYYNTFSGTKFAYMNNTLAMPNGPIDFLIFVNDTSGNEISSTTHSGNVYDNTAPVASDLTLSRDQFQVLLPIFSNSTLYLDYTYFDAEAHPEDGTEIRWYKDNGTGFTLQITRNDSTSIPESALHKGDQWYATVEPKDGELFGTLVNSSIITVKNTPPQISSLVISPSNPVTTQQLTASNTTTDHDGDSITAYEVRWFNPSLNSSYTNLSIITSDQTSKGETWWCELRAYDGFNYSVWVKSNNVTIENSVPSANSLDLTPSNPKTFNTLTATYSYFDADNDTESGSIIRWYKNSILQGNLNDSLAVDSSLTSKGENWYFTVTPYDGTDYGSLQQSSTVTIENTAPEATSLQITPASPLTANTLTASYTFNDTDNDDESGSTIIWYKNDVLQGALNDSINVSSSYTSKGEIWHFKVRPSDGTDYGTWVKCPTNVTIGNTGPSASNANIVPSSPKTGNDLTANYDYSDPDSDPESGSDIIWYLNGVLQGALNGSFIVAAGNTTKGDEWHFKIHPKDGADFGSWMGSTNITIGNTAPTASNLAISPSTLKTHQNLTASYTFSDVDSDSESGSLIRWYKNGLLQVNLNDSLIIDSSLTTKGENWYFTVNASDGSDYGSLQQSSTVTIENAAPEATSLQIAPGSPVTATTLITSYTFNDNDSDSETGSLIMWYKNDVLQGALNDSNTVSSSYTAKGEVWHFKVRPSDGG